MNFPEAVDDLNEFGADVSFMDRIFGVDKAHMEATERAEQRLQQLNTDQARRGIMTPAQAAWQNERIAGVSTNVILKDPKTSVAGGFQEGLAEGAANIRNTVGGGINALVRTGVGVIPWQVWVIGLVVAAGWLYGPKAVSRVKAYRGG